jgi:enoyl-CoA hydratase
LALVEMAQPAPHVRLLTLNRPERLNALDWALVGAIHDALDEVADDRDCRVAVLTGAGRGFCAGLDLTEMGTLPEAGQHRAVDVRTGGQEFIAKLPVHMRATPQIILAAVNGPAFGGGLSVALAADLRIASRSARFCSAYIRTGLSGTDIGVSWLLPRLIGASRAFDMIVSGRDVDADEAERMGLVSRVVPDDALLDSALELAAVISSYSRTGLLLTKEVMWHNLDNPSLEAAIAMENRNQNIAARSPELAEYMEAFRAKRPPRFT